MCVGIGKRPSNPGLADCGPTLHGPAAVRDRSVAEAGASRSSELFIDSRSSRVARSQCFLRYAEKLSFRSGFLKIPLFSLYLD